ncbi:MAG: DNA primase [Acidobacteria bacterium]|nr:DNA primase [Acidobacteriota bacterium]
MPLPVDFSQQVKSSTDIVRIIGEHVRLKKAGNNYVGLCPFHQEKTPSFSVHPTRQFYYCFGCGAKGDVFRFVMETEKLSFPESVRRVAQRSGIPIPASEPAGEQASPERRLRAALEGLHQKAQEFFRKQLQSPEAAAVREIIRKRGLTSEAVEEFGLGFAPGSGSALANFLSRQGFPPDVLEASGLVLRRDPARDPGGFFDRFRNRWMFPIIGEAGKIVAFAGRAMGSDQPKYLNSPETALYSKSHVLYNLFRARDTIRKEGSAVMVEGYMDAIAVFQAGVRNVVASCGTSLTEAQVRMLSRYGSEVVVSYDPDSAGVAATDRSLALLLEQGMSVRVLRLPGAMDPDEFIKQTGAEAYRDQLKAAQPFFRYLASRALELHGSNTPEAKLAGINFVLPFLAKVPNKLIRSELVADIAQKMDVNTGIILDSFRRAGLERRAAVHVSQQMVQIPPAEAMLVRLLLENRDACGEMSKLLEEHALMEELELQGIVSTILGMNSGGSAPDMAALSDRLDEPHQRLLAQIVFDKDARPVSLYEITSYINSLERRRLQRQRSTLRRQILEAEKLHDASRYVELLGQLDTVFRREKELDTELDTLL